MSEMTTVAAALTTGSDDAVAISAPGREPLSYAGLRTQMERTVAALNGVGVGRNDRVAIVLPNGPEMASAFVCIAAGATTAPLNPAYRREEFDFYLEDLAAGALVVEQGSESPALAAAEALNVPIIEIAAAADDPAGIFSFVSRRDGEHAAAATATYAEPADVALVLHTSGTTSRPKIVPLSHANICASAENIGRTLGLTPNDRCLNVMPLFHIHGLMAAVLATLRAGAEVCCSPGFNALKFFGWLDEARPTWFTAVPTMYQAILSRASRNQDVVERADLRFMRSASASLPAQVMAEVEDLFGAPLVEAYAMTEAAHQMTCNPLPPGERKPGTVGPAAGPEVAVMNEVGDLLEAGGTGEVVIRGVNVTEGYENNPEANASSFTGGWFRTGDQGVMDHDGYLTITGRLKEIINRGGEKVSPLEVDSVLMDHPSIKQVVTFALPHDKLGEEVAAAVVLREGMDTDEKGVRDYCSTRLADFKVPRKVVFLEEIPKGPTGKMQRIGLAEKLGL